jgi:hypothetical protein
MPDCVGVPESFPTLLVLRSGTGLTESRTVRHFVTGNLTVDSLNCLKIFLLLRTKICILHYTKVITLLCFSFLNILNSALYKYFSEKALTFSLILCCHFSYFFIIFLYS